MDLKSLIESFGKENIRQIAGMMSTPAGAELLQKIKGIDRDEIKKKIDSVKDGEISKEELIAQITDNPDLMKKLSDFLDRK